MRLIDADALREEWIWGSTDRTSKVECIELCDLDNAPTIDAEPVVHAHWEEVYGYVTPGGDPVWVCSNCGKGMHVWGVEASTYNRDISDSRQWVACPNCGAKMNGE